MRLSLKIGLVAVAMVIQGEGSPAGAQSDEAPVTGYAACRAGGTVTTPFPLPDGAQKRDLPRMVRHWNMNNKVNDHNGRCTMGSLGEVQEYINDLVTNPAYGVHAFRVVDHFKPDWSVITFGRLGDSGRNPRNVTVENVVSSKSSSSDRKPPAQVSASTKYVEVTGPDGKTIRLSPEVAARNKAAAEEYRRKTEDHARAKAAHDQTLANHRQNTATAASAKEQHDREVAAAAERVTAHRLALAEHAKKTASASTNEDPNRCITSPETKPGLRGNTEVRVTNGCDQKVDIVICLKRTSGDWLCGAQFGILSQRSMSFMSTNATGEIYVDAVTFGSKNKLGRPAGIIK